MAAKKSAKRSTAKKGKAAKGPSARKKAGRKRSSKGSTKKGAAPKAARGRFDTVLDAGGKTWQTLKSTTAQVVEGVKESFVGEPRPRSKGSNSR